MTIDDFEQVHSLWMEIHGFGIRSIDDSKEGVERFIRRNPTTSMVAVCDGKIVGAILCGHDGRRAGLYHVCVQENYRKHGIGQKLVERCLEALKAESQSDRLQAERDWQPLLAEPRLEILRQRELL